MTRSCDPAALREAALLPSSPSSHTHPIAAGTSARDNLRERSFSLITRHNSWYYSTTVLVQPVRAAPPSSDPTLPGHAAPPTHRLEKTGCCSPHNRNSPLPRKHRSAKSCPPPFSSAVCVIGAVGGAVSRRRRVDHHVQRNRTWPAILALPPHAPQIWPTLVSTDTRARLGGGRRLSTTPRGLRCPSLAAVMIHSTPEKSMPCRHPTTRP